MAKPARFLIHRLLLCGLLLAFSVAARAESPLEEIARRRLGQVLDLKLEIHGQTAVVYGKVKNYFEKRAAERSLLKLRGIAAVDNRIVVNPIARTDAQIKTDVNTALLAQAWLNPRKVVVKVVKNVVTLNGAVDHLSEKDWIEDIAGSVRGVKEVVNQIKVTPSAETPPRSSESVKQDVEAVLSAELGESVRKGLTVEVSNGTVALRGVVRNYYEKVGAYQAASTVPDVLAVKNLLEIE